MLFHPEVGMPIEASGLITHLGAVIARSSGRQGRACLNQNAAVFGFGRDGPVRPKTVQAAWVNQAQGGCIDQGLCFKSSEDRIVQLGYAREGAG